MEQNQLVFYEQPRLHNPDLVTAFAGWSDAAQAATGSIAHLIKMLNAKRFAQIKGDEFYDLSNVRPMVTVDRGVTTSLKMPHTSLFYWQNPKTDHDLVLLHGIEPQLHWQKFIDLILDVVDHLKIRKIYALGGMYDSTPHTRVPRISGLVNDPRLLDVLEKHNIGPINYEGPSSLHGLLLTDCAQRGIDGISLWGHAPFYIRVESNPMVCYGLLQKLAEVLEIEIDLEEVRKAGEYLRAMLDRLLAGSDELNMYLQKLEAQYDLAGTISPEISEDATRIIKEVEEFLRNERHESEPP